MKFTSILLAAMTLLSSCTNQSAPIPPAAPVSKTASNPPPDAAPSVPTTTSATIKPSYCVDSANRPRCNEDFATFGRFDLSSFWPEKVKASQEGKKPFLQFFPTAFSSEEAFYIAGSLRLQGQPNETVVMRITANGKAGADFGNAGLLNLTSVLPDENFEARQIIDLGANGILIAGETDREMIVLARDIHGTAKSEFGQDGLTRITVPRSATEQTSMRIFKVNDALFVLVKGTVVKLDAKTGRLDLAFGNKGVLRTALDILDFGVQDGRLIVLSQTNTEDKNEVLLQQFMDNGVLNRSFGKGGVVRLNLSSIPQREGQASDGVTHIGLGEALVYARTANFDRLSISPNGLFVLYSSGQKRVPQYVSLVALVDVTDAAFMQWTLDPLASTPYGNRRMHIAYASMRVLDTIYSVNIAKANDSAYDPGLLQISYHRLYETYSNMGGLFNVRLPDFEYPSALVTEKKDLMAKKILLTDRALYSFL